MARVTLGLALSLVLAAGVNLKADSGGFFCGYGYLRLTYDNCDGNWSYTNTGNGSCEIELTGNTDPNCTVYLDSDPGWGWTGVNAGGNGWFGGGMRMYD